MRAAILALCVAAFCVPATAQCACSGGAQELYFYTGNNKRFKRLDGYPGPNVSVTVVLQHNGPAFEWLAMHPTTGIVFATSGLVAPNLFSIDLGTGQVTLIGSLGLGQGVGGLDFDAAGTLYVRAFANGRIFTVNQQTGAATLLFDPGGSASLGSTVDAELRMFSLRQDIQLEVVDLVTGERTVIGPTSTTNIRALESDCDGRLFGTTGFGNLLEVDPDTAVVTTIVNFPSGGTIKDLFFARPADESTCFVGTPYCQALPNSTGAEATLSAFGSDVASDNFLELRAASLPPGQPGYLLAGQLQGFVPFPGNSQGVLCVVGVIARFSTQIQVADSAGRWAVPVDLSAVPTSPPHAVVAGETWNFQGWYRDQNPGATSNFTYGLEVAFQ